MKIVAVLVPCFAMLMAYAAFGQDSKPIIDNERVTVWDLTAAQAAAGPLKNLKDDVVRVVFGRNHGTAAFVPKGKDESFLLGTAGNSPDRVVVIALKDHPVAPLANQSGYPNAFPRPGVKKLIDNDRVTVWDYTWQPDKPTPMHFHDKDVVVVYLDDGALKSTTPDGNSVVNRYSFDFVKFNPRDRTHTELLVDGHQHAIMTELK